MSGTLFSIAFTLAAWFQPDVSTGSAPSSGASSQPAGPADWVGGIPQFGLMAVMMVVFYFVLIRPQQKKQKETEALLKALKKGQKVRTTGGIRGEIIDFKEENGDEVVLLISERVKINVLRSHVAGLAEPRTESPKS